MIASCGTDIKFNQWSSGAIVAEFCPPGGDHEFKSISWCSEGRFLAALPQEGGVPVMLMPNGRKHPDFDLETITEYETVQVPRANALSFSKLNSNTLCVGSKTGEVMVYNCNAQKVVSRMKKLPDTVNYIDYSAGDLTIVAGCKDSRLYVYDTCGKIAASFCVPKSRSLTAMSCHPSEPFVVAAGSREGYVAVWDSNTLDSKFLTKDHARGGACDVDFCLGQDLLGSIGFDKMLYLYDLRTKVHLYEKLFHNNLTAFAFKPVDMHFVVGTSQGELIYFDIRKLAAPLTTCQSHNTRIRKIAFQNEKSDVPSTKNTPPTAASKEAYEYPIAESSSAGCRTPPASEGFASSVDTQIFCRIAAGMDPSPSVTSMNPTVHTDDLPGGSGSGPYFAESSELGSSSIDRNLMEEFHSEVLETARGSIQRLVEIMNTEFLKTRMGVSRHFCVMENRNNRRWSDFNVALLKLATPPEERGESRRDNRTHDGDVSTTHSRHTSYTARK